MSLRQLRHRQNGNENTEIQGTYPQSTSIEEPDSSFLNNKGAPLEFAANVSDVGDPDDSENIDFTCIGDAPMEIYLASKGSLKTEEEC